MEGFNKPTQEINNPLNSIKNIFTKIFFKDEELLNIFNEKYKDDESKPIVFLVDSLGQPDRDREDKIIGTELGYISDKRKIEHVKGSIINKFNGNTTNVDYVKKLSKENELLDVIEKKGFRIKKLISDYEKQDNDNKNI